MNCEHCENDKFEPSNEEITFLMDSLLRMIINLGGVVYIRAEEYEKNNASIKISSDAEGGFFFKASADDPPPGCRRRRRWLL